MIQALFKYAGRMLSCAAAGAKVLDLGCVPGAWMQVACKELGPHDRGGLVLGIDIQEVRCCHPACPV